MRYLLYITALLLFVLSGTGCLFDASGSTKYGKDKWNEENKEPKFVTYDEYLDSMMYYNPKEADHFYRKSVRQFRDGEIKSGVANLTYAAELEPGSYLSYLGYIKMLYLKDFEGAEKDFEKALESGQLEDFTIAGSTYLRLGIAKLKLGKYMEAITYFEKNEAHFGKKNVLTYNYVYKGLAKHLSGDYEGALHDFDEALAQWEKCPEAHYQKGKVLLDLGKKNEACKEVKKAMLYENFIWGNPRRAYINQLYVTDMEILFDQACR